MFVIGAPYVKVVNVTKDAIWVRDARLVGLGNLKKPGPADILELAVDTSRGIVQFVLPDVKMPREQQQDEYVRRLEIDPARHTPADVKRDLVLEMPKMKAILETKVKNKVKQLKAKLAKGK